ncbi:unnamed protein product, partial [Laminaria digitata]
PALSFSAERKDGSASRPKGAVWGQGGETSSLARCWVVVFCLLVVASLRERVCVSVTPRDFCRFMNACTYAWVDECVLCRRFYIFGRVWRVLALFGFFVSRCVVLWQNDKTKSVLFF